VVPLPSATPYSLCASAASRVLLRTGKYPPFLFFSLASLRPTNSYVVTQAQIIHNNLPFCSYVNWNSAGAINVSSAAQAYYQNPRHSLTTLAQDTLANKIYDSLVALNTIDAKGYVDMCRDAMQRFSCVSAFPLCPAATSSAPEIAYFKPCWLQCHQIQTLCGISSM
jgi:hypothetical protein